MTLEEMRARAAEIADRLDEITGLPDEEVTDELRDETDTLLAESDEIVAGIEQAETRAAKVANLREVYQGGKPGTVEPGAPIVPVPGAGEQDPFDMRSLGFAPPASELRSRALTAIEKFTDSHLTDAQRSQMARLVERKDDGRGSIATRILVTGSDVYKRAWTKAVTGRTQTMTSDESAALERAMSLTDGSGGFAVPPPIDPTLIMLGDGSSNPFRRISRVEPITNDVWRGVASTALTASWDGEAAEVSDDTTTFTQPSVTAHKAQAFVPASIEIAQDYPNLAGDLVDLFQQAKDDLEATAFATGTGSSQPFGIVTAIDGTGNDIGTVTTDVFAIADVYTVHETLGPKYRDRATWAMNVAILNDVRQFATANNYHGFTVDLTAANIPAILGRPVAESSAMDGTVTALAENNIVVFGDFSNYLIADRVGFTVEFIPHLFATANNLPSGQRGWYAYWRVGADSVNDDAFVLLNAT